MGRISYILQKNNSLKNTLSHVAFPKGSYHKYEGKKSCQAHPYLKPEAFQDVNFRGYDRFERATLNKLRSAVGNILTKDECRIFINHMGRVEGLASMGMLSATMAHELTQLLTIISLSLEDILDELEAAILPLESTVGDLKDVLVQLSHLTKMIHRFRNLARKEPEKIVNSINLKLVAEKIVTILSKSARQKRIQLQIRELERLHPVRMNEREIEELFLILVENAIQAADGRTDRKLSISGTNKDRSIELCFSDNCGGIAPELLEGIFDPFFTTKPPNEGTGLGLYIVNSIVSRINGDIRVKSDYGEGCTFFVSLPIDKDDFSFLD